MSENESLPLCEFSYISLYMPHVVLFNTALGFVIGAINWLSKYPVVTDTSTMLNSLTAF